MLIRVEVMVKLSAVGACFLFLLWTLLLRVKSNQALFFFLLVYLICGRVNGFIEGKISLDIEVALVFIQNYS